MKLRSTRNFDLRIRGILRKNPSLAEEVRDIVKQVVAGDNLEGLRIHKLKGSQKMFWSVSVNPDLRIIFYCQKDVIVLADVGTHKDVYEKN
ncbi:type II toxin-antitoxin system mRNA interferase toxin, RelE/StbE family [Candidatus Shapirobacteria bacterium]|nr:type II toxin-antitoxin system mRNA interferase toxin, RelE/StbE family [Candidatus Shapirobacteria bacterium]